MTIYQKAIKVRKTCENQKQCIRENECIYYKNCVLSNIIHLDFQNIMNMLKYLFIIMVLVT